MKTKLAETEEMLNCLGDLDGAIETLRKFKRNVEAEVLNAVSELMFENLDPELMVEASEEAKLESEEDIEKTAGPMTQQEKIMLRRKMKMHKPKAKRWLCCTKPKKQMTHGKTHKSLYLSTCKYTLLAGKHRGQVRAMRIVVGRGSSPPRSIVRSGKKIKICSSSQ